MVTGVRYMIDGQTYEMAGGAALWDASGFAPMVPGDYGVALEVDDQACGKLRFEAPACLMVTGGEEEAQTLMALLPPYWHNVAQMQAILWTLAPEVYVLRRLRKKAVEDTRIDTMDGGELAKLEQFLDIAPQGNEMQRRAYIKALKSPATKLTPQIIRQMVRTITGSDAQVKLYEKGGAGSPAPQDVCLEVRVLFASGGWGRRFEDVYRVLRPRLPMHLALCVKRNYSTWGDARRYGAWAMVHALSSWRELKDTVLE